MNEDESIADRVPAVDIELRYVLGFIMESEVCNDVWSDDTPEFRCENRSDNGLSGTYIDVPQPSGGVSRGDGGTWSFVGRPCCADGTVLWGDLRGSGGEVSWC